MLPKTSIRDRIRNIRSSLGGKGDSQNPLPTSPVVPSAVSPLSSAATTAPPAANAPDTTTTSVETQNASEQSVSSSLASPSLVPTPMAKSEPDKSKGTGNTAKPGLETAMNILAKSADALPLLKLAVSELVGCLDTIQMAGNNRDDYEAITTELTSMADTISKCMDEFKSEHISDAINNITSSINKEVEHIKARQSRSKMRQMLDSVDDREDITRCYRRVEGLFRQLQNNINLSRLYTSHSNALTMLERLKHMEPEKNARYNSSYSTAVKRHGCTAETREKIQHDLQSWVADPNAPRIYWMDGMAGTGKTTIAYSLCEWLEERKQLGASFFCSRASSSCRDANRIVPTIAYFLACYSSVFRLALNRALGYDMDASRLNIELQFKKLLQQPMQKAKDSLPEGIVIVIDALDECENTSEVRLFLETLLELGTDLPVKFLITSRPEHTIRGKMLSQGGYSPSVLHLHDIEQASVEGDINKYLTKALSSMPQPPSPDQIQLLAKQSGRLFIYAATVVRYILPDGIAVNNRARLKAMLAIQPQPPIAGGLSKKYKDIDRLYKMILTSAFNDEVLEEEELQTMRLVLATVVCALEPLTAHVLGSILALEDEQVLSSLQPLRSVLHISEDRGLISTFHASFPDYLCTQGRSGLFCINEGPINALLGDRCFEVMKQLRFNICGLESSFLYDEEVPDLGARVKQEISEGLFYACRFWSGHLRQAATTHSLLAQLVDFLSFRLLFWIEALNLSRCIAVGSSSLLVAQKWLLRNDASADVRRQIADAWSFVTRFTASQCTRSTPHLYISALPFCPKSSSVYGNYWNRFQGIMDVQGTAITYRADTPLATWLTDSATEAIAISRDGTKLALGFDDYTIRICDSQNGVTIAGPFRGHDGAVQAVAFSSDGSRLLSGSSDGSVRVWDSLTGAQIFTPFLGHSEPVISVAFSSDGTRIISASSAGAIRMWDAATGETLTLPFAGYLGPITSLAFSPDDTYIAIGSTDCTIRILDALTGAMVAGPLEGHAASVTSVAFFSDQGNTYVVSGSDDQTIRTWDMETCKATGLPFEGHNQSISSVSVFPDGTRIISGSRDHTVRTWDRNMTTNGFKRGRWMLERHRNRVKCVALSHDSTLIASGSHDCTIRIWDTKTGSLVAKPMLGHSGSVNTVTFSPNSTWIASGSMDKTIRVWDSQTTALVTGPLEAHSGAITCVAFACDGAQIASGSDDTNVRIWDTRTGELIGDSLRGHSDAVIAIAFSSDGSQLVSGSRDKTIRVWSLSSRGTVAGPFQADGHSVASVALSFDNSRIVSGGLGGVRLWDVRTGDIVAKPLEEQTSSVKCVSFIRDEAQVAFGCCDSSIGVWDVQSGSMVVPMFRTDVKPVSAIAFSPRELLAVSATDGWYRPKSQTFPTIRTTPLIQRHSSTHPLGSRWRFVHNGWILGRIEGNEASTGSFEASGSGTNETVLLFCVPPELHDSLTLPHNDIAIGPSGSTRIDYQGLVLGENWSECYRGSM